MSRPEPPRTAPAAPDEVVVGLDVGTSATKAVAFGPGGWSRLASRDYPLQSPAPDRREQDPGTIAEAVLGTLADLAVPLAGTRVRAIAVSAAMHGLVGLDGDHAPVTPLVTWADGRAVADARWLAREHPGLHAATGTPMHPMAPLATLRWFIRERPDTADRVRWWVGLKEWVLLVLTGELVTEPSSASGTGLLDLASGQWHREAARLAGTTVDRLPRIVPVDTRLALADEAAARTDLPGDVEVVAGAADGPLANLGVGAMEPGVVGVSLGTSGAARLVVSAPPRPLDPALFDYLLADGLHVVGGAASTGGLVADWAAEALAPDLGDTPDQPRIARLLGAAGAVPAGSAGVVALPHLLPPRAPHLDPDLAGTWLGVRTHHDRRHLVRAAVEGVALHLADVVARLEQVATVRQVRATGGALRSTLWQTSLADALDRPVTLVGAAGGTALGAAALGWMALGRAGDLSAARAALAPAEEPVTVLPDPDRVAALQAVRHRREELLAALVAATGSKTPPAARGSSRPARPSTATRGGIPPWGNGDRHPRRYGRRRSDPHREEHVVRIGVHVPGTAPLEAAAARGADLVQMFLTAPQSYDPPPERDDTAEVVASDVPVYVHAPYLINVATGVNRIRHPSRANLEQTVRAAEAIGAAGVVVHGGHVADDDDPETGYANWRTTLDRLETTVPILIENTAGGTNAMARRVDRMLALFDVLDGTETPHGLCLDTCHLWAGGDDLVDGTRRLLDGVGRIDLVHANDSRDEADSGRDRHANLGAGQVDPEALVEVVRLADADVVLETPGGVDDHVADLAWLRDRL